MNPPSPVSGYDGRPFHIGRQYRVRKDFRALRDTFRAGEVLSFDSAAWSRYDGITGYFFTQEGREGLRLWDIDDDVDVSCWVEFFDLLPQD